MQSRLPNLIIGGVHKAGTTSLFVYLSKHPDICASRIKEIGYFMPLRDGGPLPPLEEYHSYFTHCQHERYVMEASPSYLYGKDKIADAILEHCGPSKIIMILREPVDRLGSFYNHIRSKAMLDEPVDMPTFIRKSLEGIHDQTKQDYFTRGVREGFYSDYLEDWFNRFGDNLKVVFFDDLKNRPMELTGEICQWLGLPADRYKPEDFTVENKTVYYKNKAVHKFILRINRKLEAFWRRNHAFKKKLRSFYYLFNAAASKGEKVDERSGKLLSELYKPYNQSLKSMLKERGYTNLPGWLENS
ncbi:MAG: sulfotransferase [Bacteroidia bacterium]|nr:sulfotransferase [Bacteroidia bacterium]